jgi:hypothetical protein
MPGGIGSFGFIDNEINYVYTLTIRGSDLRSCHPLYLDSGGETRTATGVLTNSQCGTNLLEIVDLDWSPMNMQGRNKSIIVTSDEQNQCAVIRRCTFLNLESVEECGGAISFLVGTQSTADISDCQFTSCVTSRTDVTLHGGAMETQVDRLFLSRVCGSFCVSYNGQFLRSDEVKTWCEMIDSSVYNCSSEGLYGGEGGMTLSIHGGLLEMRNTNFSDCRQGNGAAILEIIFEDLTLNISTISRFVTCSKCSAARGFDHDYNFGILYEYSAFIDNSNTREGWYVLVVSTTVAFRDCLFARHIGDLFYAREEASNIRVISCQFDGNIQSSVSKAIIWYIDVETNHINLPILRTKFSQSCYGLYLVSTSSQSAVVVSPSEVTEIVRTASQSEVVVLPSEVTEIVPSSQKNKTAMWVGVGCAALVVVAGVLVFLYVCLIRKKNHERDAVAEELNDEQNIEEVDDSNSEDEVRDDPIF